MVFTSIISRAVTGNRSKAKSCITFSPLIRRLSQRTLDDKAITDDTNQTTDRVTYVTQRHEYNNKVNLNMRMLYIFQYIFIINVIFMFCIDD